MSEVEAVVGGDDSPSSGASGVVSSDAVVPSAGDGGGAAATPAADGRVVGQVGALEQRRTGHSRTTPSKPTKQRQFGAKINLCKWRCGGRGHACLFDSLNI